MKTEFLQPRFTGERFTEHTLPVELARDLAAYETLVIELAKHLYLKDHPKKQRVPKGFSNDFQLHIERVDDGSAKPLLSLVTAGFFAITPGDHFDRARELITECIGAPTEQLPVEFPRELLWHFNQFGRSLRSDESIEFTGRQGKTTVLTQDRRKSLVLAVDRVYEKEIELVGSIEEADWEKSTFRLRTLDGNRIVVPMPDAFHTNVRNFGGRHRHVVFVKCIGAFDSWDRLQKIVFVDTLEIQHDYQLASRFDELRTLENGWFENAGIAPDKTMLDFIASKMIGQYPENLQLPTIVPTPEGNLLLEWAKTPGYPSVDINLGSLNSEFHAFDEKSGDVEMVFDLSRDESWTPFYEYLSKKIEKIVV